MLEAGPGRPPEGKTKRPLDFALLYFATADVPGLAPTS
jgi:hypothetical protein